MFSIGPLEVVVIMIVALVIVGPEKLPELARMAARALRDLRKYADDIRREFERDTQEIKEDLSALTHDAPSEHYPYSGVSGAAEGEPYRYEEEEGRYEEYEDGSGYGAQEEEKEKKQEETGEGDANGSSNAQGPLHDDYPPD